MKRPMATRPDPSTLRGPVLLLVVLTGLFALLGGVLSTLAPTEFTVKTRILVQPLEGNPYSPTAQGSDLTTLETEAQVVISDAVQGSAADELRERYPNLDLTRGVSAAVIPNSQIVEITTRGGNEQVSMDVAGALATAYLERRISQRDDVIDSRRTDLAQRIRTVQQQIRTLRRGGQGDNAPEIQALGGQLLNLRVQSAAITTGSSPGIVLDEPTVTSSGLQISWLLGALVGGVMGLVVAVLLLVAQQVRRSPVRSPRDIESLGFPWIGTVERADADDDTAVAAAASLALRSGTSPLTLALVSLTDEVSTVDLAAAIGRHLGTKDVDCLVITADGQASPHPGLSEVLAGTASVQDVCRDLAPGVRQMSVGHEPAQGQLLLTTPRLPELIKQSAQAHDVIVVASPPGGGPAGHAVMHACDFWIPVVRFGSSLVDIERSLSRVQDVQTPALGSLTIQPGVRERSPAPDDTAALDG